MKKLIYAIIFSIGFLSCNKENKTSYKDSFDIDTIYKTRTIIHNDTAWNDRIQDSFWGITFGEYKRPIIKKMESKGFYQDTSYSIVNNPIRFKKKTGERFDFENLKWQYLITYYAEGELCEIDFLNKYKTSEDAINDFEQIISTIGGKYNIRKRYSYDDECNDTGSTQPYTPKQINHIIYDGFGRNGVVIAIFLMNKEVTLCYYHRKYDEYQDYYEKYYNDEEEEGSLKPTDDGNNATNGGLINGTTQEQRDRYRVATGDYTSTNEEIAAKIIQQRKKP